MDVDLIRYFCDVTNATKEVAESYLEVSNGNVEQAINLYLESGGVSGIDPSEVVDTRIQQSTSSSTNAERTMNTFDSDAELARALAQQEESTIRAPIAPKRDILVGGDQNNYVGLDGGMIRRGVPRTRNSRDNSYRTFAGDALPHRMGSSDRLTDLFSPPFDIISKENFERTRNRARNEGRWLMVDIQNIREFACQVLNRDLWVNKTVKDVIKAHFLFLQYNSESPDGRQYINYYPIDGYPHVAIIDPRTGERVRVWKAQKLTPDEFIISVTDFLDHHSLSDSTKQAPTPKIKPVAEMSEEEQLKAAMEKSLEEEQKSASESENYDDDEIEDTEEEDEDEDSVIEEAISTFDSIKPVEREEAQGPTSAMIKFRLADGQTVIRRFEKLNPVRYLFEFIKTVPNLKGQEFELVCHRNNLINQVDETIEDAGLSNSLVNVVLG